MAILLVDVLFTLKKYSLIAITTVDQSINTTDNLLTADAKKTTTDLVTIAHAKVITTAQIIAITETGETTSATTLTINHATTLTEETTLVDTIMADLENVYIIADKSSIK